MRRNFRLQYERRHSGGASTRGRRPYPIPRTDRVAHARADRHAERETDTDKKPDAFTEPERQPQPRRNADSVIGMNAALGE